ncbi:MAG TPA: hypothetical protein VHF05_00070 [Candidatus Paceibacterota bacterium]|jgi:hypothetical protein|nr:hypothetical protein [Candidatus Paceibacterota bacterium]
MKTKEREKAILLRKKGESINVIAHTIGVSKASVSTWVRDISLTQRQRNQLIQNQFNIYAIEKRRKSRLSNELAKRQTIIDEAKKDIKSISKIELKLIGCMLYWAEGRKRGQRVVSFSNSDPMIIRVIMRFFREICFVSEAKFRCHIHTYSHVNVSKAEKYWSDITGLPLNQFYKTYSKPSKSSQSKMDILPYGTLDVDVCDAKLFLTIIGWIEKIYTLVLD